MNDLTVDTATVNSVATTYATIATEIRTAGSHLQVDDAALGAVFGVIGGDFTSAVHTSTHGQRDRIATLADAAHRIGADLRDAGEGYRTTDHSAASGIASSGSGSRVV